MPQRKWESDGVRFETMNPPWLHAAIVSCLKIISNLDISERRLPQDGRVRTVVQGIATPAASASTNCS